MKIYCLIFLIFIASVSCRVAYLFSMVRHGAIYPKNSLYDGNETAQFKGLLTTVGMRQQYNLGSYLRQSYIMEAQLTTPKFTPSQIEFYASSYPRTQNSVLALLYGLYPLGNGWTIPDGVTSDKFNPPYTPLFPENLRTEVTEQPFALNKGFQALPVRPLDDILDNCPNYDKLLEIRQAQIAERVAIFQLEQSTQLARVKLLFNLTTAQANIPTMSDLYETLESDQNLARAMPPSYTANDNKNLKFIYEYYNTLLQSGNFARTMITPSLRMLRQKLDSVVKNDTTTRLSLISCHSSNLWPLLTQLNLTSAECITQQFRGEPITALNCVAPPHFSANLLFELQEDDQGEYFVRIRYNGEYLNLCQIKETRCPYKSFISRVLQTEVSFEKECKIPKQSQIQIQ